MPRYTIYRGDAGEDDVDVAEQVRSAGARVIAVKPGLALIDASDEAVDRLRKALRVADYGRAHGEDSEAPREGAPLSAETEPSQGDQRDREIILLPDLPDLL